MLLEILPSYLKISSRTEEKNREEVLAMNRIIMFSAALCSLLLILPLAAHADVVTIDRDWAFIDNRPADDIFGFTGLRLNLTVRALDDPGGYAALTGLGSSTQATASNGSFPFLQPVTYSNPNDFFPVSGGAEFTRLLPIGGNPFSSVTGTYTYTVMNINGDIATSTTHNLDKPDVIPIPTNLAFSDHSTTPVFTFSDPDDTDGPAGLGRRYLVEIFDGTTKINIFSSDVLTEPYLDFKLIDPILEAGKTYYFRAVSFDFDSTETSSSVHTRMENRAIEYATFNVPELGTIFLLGSGLIGLAGYGRRKFLKK
jgi:hypothetical protein